VDGFLALTTICRASAGQCDVAESCTGSSGACPADLFQPLSTSCVSDADACTIEHCDGAGSCVFQENDPACVAAICRTPGFYATHAGTEKKNSQNITQALLDAAPGGSITICGEELNNTDAGNTNSALEALCVPVKGEQRLQLARQLTAAALNCILSGASNCDSLVPGYDTCDAACESNTPADQTTFSGCITLLDNFNNGIGAQPGCHDQPLENDSFDFEPPGPAGSSNECNVANGNGLTIFD
jgi:hypothetical protein